MKLLITFIFFNILNVIIQTVKSIATIKCNKYVASLVNAIAYGLYTYIVVLMVCELPLIIKMGIVALANLIGVFVVKLFEEKSRKDKLWLVKCTIPKDNAEKCRKALENANISFSWIDIESYVVFDTYCDKQWQTEEVIKIAKTHRGKTFATENKL